VRRQRFRLDSGGRIDRARPLAFTFDGRRYGGYAGDTLASALLANGVHFVGRGFKYHRPRGILSAGVEEPNALVRHGVGARADPNTRATVLALHEGLRAASQNCWPSLGFDIGAINDRLAALIPAGFYYKTFMRPARLWRFYEHFIRQAAGLGRAPDAPDPDRYAHRHAHCDVLVVGAGPAGLAAAMAAGASGARVILADEQGEFGGALLSDGGGPVAIGDAPPAAFAARARDSLRAMAEVRLLPRCTAFGYYADNLVVLLERLDEDGPVDGPVDGGRARQRVWKIRARRVVLATGALERPLVFADNDRPGIMLAGAARSYVNRYGVRPGARAVVFTNNDSAYAAALDMAGAGMTIEAIVDTRIAVEGELPRLAREAGIPVLQGSVIVGAAGRRRVRAVTVKRLAGDGLAGPVRRLACDCVAMSGGWNPTVHLFSQSRGTLEFQAEAGIFVPDQAAQAVQSAGACNGEFSLAGCLAEGDAAGRAAARACGFEGGAASPPAVREPQEAAPATLWRVPQERPGARAFVDFQNDVTTQDLDLALREGYRSIEHVKRYTTAGMGTDQGKTANVNALANVAQTLGVDIASLGVTTFRAPYTPVTFGAIAGRHVGEQRYDPIRRTALQGWHEARGAVFEDVGQWKRARYYPENGETMRQAVDREGLAARAGVGILDYSTLGKIEICGPDAAQFLNRVYTNGWLKLAVGRCRYGMMLGDDGMVMDDGVTVRLAEDRYLMTTTTGNAALVLNWLEEWLQTEWLDLAVYCTSVTEQYAVISLCGPEARAVLARVAPDMALDARALPHMAMAEGVVAGAPARILRVSFTGEVGFEISIAPSCALAVWEALMDAGASRNITPYGTEAMHVLRAEKGYVIVGQDTDGTMTPLDLGMDWIVNRTKGDFIGRRSLIRADTERAGREQLVGLLTVDPRTVLAEGAPLVAAAEGGPPPTPMIGHVTSSYHSAALDRSIALAVLRDGRARIGETVFAAMADRTIEAVVSAPAFLDPTGERLNG
jgi:sarcosine oxidase subunit alpha